MNVHGIKHQIDVAMDAVSKDISDQARGGKYASGLSSEGYAGGYRDALNDMTLALNSVVPNNSRYWPKRKQ